MSRSYKRSKRRKSKNIKSFISIIILIFTSLLGFYKGLELVQDTNQIQDINTILQEENLIVSFIDVGQGESILIEAPSGEKMLIDAGGTKDDASYNYLKEREIDKLDVIVITHPHSDHISELSKIICDLEVSQIYMPKVSHTSKTFEELITNISENNILVTEAKAGTYIDFSPEITCLIVAPNSDNYSDLNNWSTVVHLTYQDTKFLFTGDAEIISENEILENGFDIQSNLLNIGHHGSSSSTSQEFLDTVNPEYAVISAGENNSYGHPSQVVMNRLSEKGVETYVTAEVGTVVAISDGKGILILNDYYTE